MNSSSENAGAILLTNSLHVSPKHHFIPPSPPTQLIQRCTDTENEAHHENDNAHGATHRAPTLESHHRCSSLGHVLAACPWRESLYLVTVLFSVLRSGDTNGSDVQLSGIHPPTVFPVSTLYQVLC